MILATHAHKELKNNQLKNYKQTNSFHMAHTLLFSPGPTEIILIILALLLLFGGRKIPELMRGLGKGMKEFKNAQKEEDDDEKKSSKDTPDEKKDD